MLQLGVVPSRGFLSLSCVAHGNSNAAGKSWTVNPDFAWNQHCGAFLTLQLKAFLQGEQRPMAARQGWEVLV